MPEIIFKTDSYRLVGVLYDVYNNLGNGFLEIVYKDAIELELSSRNISFEREKEYPVSYKGKFLKHKFYADFVVDNKIILEVKCCDSFDDKHIAQCLNYLKVSGKRLAILVNYKNKSLEYKRVVLR